MAITTFTAAQVLTAAQMNAVQSNDFNQTVSTKTASYTLVAADKGTRIAMNSASATTITVNDSLFSASDTLVLQNIGAGVCTVTAGTATVSSAGALAIPQFGSGTLFFTSAGVSIFFPSAGAVSASGLTLISATTVGTTVSSVTVSNAFSATYDSYKIILSAGTSSNASNIKFKLGTTATGYFTAMPGVTYAGGGTNDASDDNGTSFTIIGGLATNGNNLNLDIVSPFLNQITFITGGVVNAASGQAFVGKLNDTTSYTAFTLTPALGTMSNSIIRVYGYANS